MRALIHIHAKSAVPVYLQVYGALRDGVLSGRFAAASRVPSSRELAESIGIARSTVAHAYDQLIAEGYLYAVRGAGTFVARELPESLLQAQTPGRRATHGSPKIRLSRFGRRLDVDFKYPRRKAGHISFAHWSPDTTRLPFSTWRRSLLRQLRHPVTELLDYAYDIQGYEPLRREIANYLGRSRAVNCTAEHVIVVNGSQQALDLCARVLLDPNDSVAFENPGYLGSRRIFAAHGLKLCPVRVDDEGLVCRDLRAGTRAVYVTPSHQFPLGVALSLSRRLELIAWARAHQAVIIEDDYDSEYRYSGAPLPALQGLTPDAPVVYCGSFSKVLFPGMRVGYLVVPRELIAPFRRAKWLSDRNTPMLEQFALADFLRSGHFDRHVRRMRRLYANRRAALVAAVARHFGERAQVRGDAAGMHAVVRIEDAGLMSRAERRKVQLRATTEYYVGDAPANEYIFGFAGLTERVIAEGIRRLATP